MVNDERIAFAIIHLYISHQVTVDKPQILHTSTQYSLTFVDVGEDGSLDVRVELVGHPQVLQHQHVEGDVEGVLLDAVIHEAPHAVHAEGLGRHSREYRPQHVA